MNVNDVVNYLQSIAPFHYAEGWDNVGLLIGDKQRKVEKILVALDPSTEVIEQAVKQKCDMIITHHPLIFSPMKSVTSDNFIGRRVMTLIENRIAYCVMHTNMDIVVMADVAAEKIGLKDSNVLEPVEADNNEGIGRYGSLAEPVTLGTLATRVKEAFSLGDVRVVGNCENRISKVAISTGSGEDYVDKAITVGMEVLITGDIRHHKAVDALEKGLMIIDAGHFGTERFMAEWLGNKLKSSFENNRENTEVVVAVENSPFQTV